MTWERFFQMFREYRIEMLISGIIFWIIFLLALDIAGVNDNNSANLRLKGSVETSAAQRNKVNQEQSVIEECIVIDGVEICSAEE